MRHKKHKKVRRTVRWLKVCYGYREPYKVILDGNFLHALLQTTMGEPEGLISKLLGGAVKVYTPKCVLHELKGLGKEFEGTARECKRHMPLQCEHEGGPVSASECILAQIGDSNPQHFLVATQDRRLRNALAAIPGAASVFASINGIHLEQPSEQQLQQAKQVQARQAQPAAHELEAGPLKALALQQQAERGGAARRRKAKGPNPLSVRKKGKAGAPVAAGVAAAAAGEGKRTRQRARRKRAAESADQMPSEHA